MPIVTILRSFHLPHHSNLTWYCSVFVRLSGLKCCTPSIFRQNSFVFPS